MKKEPKDIFIKASVSFGEKDAMAHVEGNCDEFWQEMMLHKALVVSVMNRVGMTKEEAKKIWCDLIDMEDGKPIVTGKH